MEIRRAKLRAALEGTLGQLQEVTAQPVVLHHGSRFDDAAFLDLGAEEHLATWASPNSCAFSFARRMFLRSESCCDHRVRGEQTIGDVL